MRKLNLTILVGLVVAVLGFALVFAYGSRVDSRVAEGRESVPVLVATATAAAGLTPAELTGLLEVRETTCTKCHDQGGTFIGSLVDQAILYGDIWGVDRIFSFHPFEPSAIDASGNENRSVRAALRAIVTPFDAATHPARVYPFYRPTR